jgi:hypothetical protein
VRPRAFTISSRTVAYLDPEALQRQIYHSLRCGLIGLDMKFVRPAPIFCPLRLLLLHMKFNQPTLNLGDESAPFGR